MTDTRDAALTLWQFHCVYDDLSPSDAIVGLGSYDLRVASHCADLYHRGLAPRILFTGASGNWTRDMFQTTEAEAFKDHAIQNGVPPHAITLEPQATNIGDIARMPTYAARGFQIAVPLPHTVQDAFDQLVQAGFTDHLPTDP